MPRPKDAPSSKRSREHLVSEPNQSKHDKTEQVKVAIPPPAAAASIRYERTSDDIASASSTRPLFRRTANQRLLASLKAPSKLKRLTGAERLRRLKAGISKMRKSDKEQLQARAESKSDRLRRDEQIYKQERGEAPIDPLEKYMKTTYQQKLVNLAMYQFVAPPGSFNPEDADAVDQLPELVVDADAAAGIVEPAVIELKKILRNARSATIGKSVFVDEEERTSLTMACHLQAPNLEEAFRTFCDLKQKPGEPSTFQIYSGLKKILFPVFLKAEAKKAARRADSELVKVLEQRVEENNKPGGSKPKALGFRMYLEQRQLEEAGLKLERLKTAVASAEKAVAEAQEKLPGFMAQQSYIHSEAAAKDYAKEVRRIGSRIKKQEAELLDLRASVKPAEEAYKKAKSELADGSEEGGKAERKRVHGLKKALLHARSSRDALAKSIDHLQHKLKIAEARVTDLPKMRPAITAECEEKRAQLEHMKTQRLPKAREAYQKAKKEIERLKRIAAKTRKEVDEAGKEAMDAIPEIEESSSDEEGSDAEEESEAEDDPMEESSSSEDEA